MDFFSIAKKQFLKDYNLKEFPKEQIYIQESKPFRSCAMNYLSGTPFLNFVYYGNKLFISSNPKIYDFVYAYVKQCEQDLFRVFDAPNILYLNNELEKYGYTIAHLAQYFLPDESVTVKPSQHYPIRLLQQEQIEELYSLGFNMALCGTIKKKRKDILASICEMDGKIVGVAGCTNDSEELWQIGVDVLPQYRNRGIATALVLHLKDEIIKRGKCPFYCCAWSDLASKRLARKAGFVDAWVELSAKSLEEEWIKNIRR